MGRQQTINDNASQNDCASRSPRWGEYGNRALSHGLEARGYMRLPFQGRRYYDYKVRLRFDLLSMGGVPFFDGVDDSEKTRETRLDTTERLW